MDDWDIRPSAPEPPPVRPESPPEIAVRMARRGVLMLRIVAVVILTVGLIGQISYWRIDDPQYVGQGPKTPFTYRLWLFLQGLGEPLGFAGLVLAASVVAQVMIARIAVLTGTDDVVPSKRPDAGGDLIVKAPPRSVSQFTASNGDDSIWRPRESVDG